MPFHNKAPLSQLQDNQYQDNGAGFYSQQGDYLDGAINAMAPFDQQFNAQDHTDMYENEEKQDDDQKDENEATNKNVQKYKEGKFIEPEDFRRVMESFMEVGPEKKKNRNKPKFFTCEYYSRILAELSTGSSHEKIEDSKKRAVFKHNVPREHFYQETGGDVCQVITAGDYMNEAVVFRRKTDCLYQSILSNKSLREVRSKKEAYMKSHHTELHIHQGPITTIEQSYSHFYDGHITIVDNKPIHHGRDATYAKLNDTGISDQFTKGLCQDLINECKVCRKAAKKQSEAGKKAEPQKQAKRVLKRALANHPENGNGGEPVASPKKQRPAKANNRRQPAKPSSSNVRPQNAQSSGQAVDPEGDDWINNCGNQPALAPGNLPQQVAHWDPAPSNFNFGFNNSNLPDFQYQAAYLGNIPFGQPEAAQYPMGGMGFNLVPNIQQHNEHCAPALENQDPGFMFNPGMNMEQSVPAGLDINNFINPKFFTQNKDNTLYPPAFDIPQPFNPVQASMDEYLSAKQAQPESSAPIANNSLDEFIDFNGYAQLPANENMLPQAAQFQEPGNATYYHDFLDDDTTDKSLSITKEEWAVIVDTDLGNEEK